MNDLKTVMEAISVVESAKGKNSYPRFERSYAPKGETFTVQGHVIVGTGTNMTVYAQARWFKWGMASACSYGPWQMLYHTAADHGFNGAPWELWGGSEPWVKAALMRLYLKGARTIQLLADAWNSGSFQDANVPGDYINHVTAAFKLLGGDPSQPIEI